jgi:hypothetical protein
MECFVLALLLTGFLLTCLAISVALRATLASLAQEALNVVPRGRTARGRYAVR